MKPSLPTQKNQRRTNQIIIIEKKLKTKPISQQVEELLKSISHEELIAFVQESIEINEQFRNSFLSAFGHLNQKQLKEFYQKHIHSILKTAAGRGGWIDWHNFHDVLDALQPLIDNSEKYFDNNQFENVYYINTALIEEMIDALEYSDDSYGDVGSLIEEAMEFLLKLTHKNLPVNLRKDLFEYCISSFNKDLFRGWTWNLDLLQIASELTENENEADTVLDRLNSADKNFESKRAQAIRLNILKKYKHKSEIDTFVNQHISNKLIRTNEVENAFKEKDFDRIIELAKGGIKCTEKEMFGSVDEWYNWLLKVAISQENKQKIIEYARFLLFKDFYSAKKYYQILKNTVDSDKWHSFLEDIITEINHSLKGGNSNIIRLIYIEEAWWDKLFLDLKQNPSLIQLELDDPYLSETYANEFIQLYKNEIIKYLETQTGKTNYQRVCKHIRRMQELGGTEQAKNLIEELKRQYPRRKALIAALDQI